MAKIRCTECRKKFDPMAHPACPKCGNRPAAGEADMASPFPVITEALSSGRPVPFWTVVDAIEDAGIDTGDDPEAFMDAVLSRMSTVVELADSNLMDIAATFTDVVFTTPVGPDTWNELDTQLDLTLISMLADSPRPLLVNDERVATTGQGGYRLHQQRWLWETTEDTVAGLTITRDGAIAVIPAMQPVAEVPEALIEHLTATIQKHREHDDLPRWEPIIFQGLATFENLPTALPPLTDLLHETGHEIAGIDFVVPLGFDLEDALADASDTGGEEE